MKAKKDLIRIVHSSSGETDIDQTGKMPGRGAYICADRNCLAAVIKTKRLERALKCTISDDLYKKLESKLNTDENGN